MNVLNALELPGLPVPAIVDPGRFGACYTAEQMSAYAAAAQQIATSRVISAAQSAADSLAVPDKLTPARAEYWKAGARAAIRAFNAALRGTEGVE